MSSYEVVGENSALELERGDETLRMEILRVELLCCSRLKNFDRQERPMGELLVEMKEEASWRAAAVWIRHCLHTPPAAVSCSGHSVGQVL